MVAPFTIMGHRSKWRSLLQAIIVGIGLMSEAFSTDPCMDYHELNQVRRSAAAEVEAGHSLLCDYNRPKGWYRFISYVGGEIPTTCVEPYHCGTQFPIWMNGTLPTDSTVVNRTVCPNYGVPGNCCPFPWNIQVKRCLDTQGVFYVYELVPTTSCSQAYCAGTLPICPEGEVYDQYNDICLETRHPVPCDFEAIGTCEWQQQTNDEFDWVKQTVGEGDSYLPAGGGHFLYVGNDASQQPLDTARIIAPVIVPSVVRPCNMTFSYYFSGSDAGDLDVFTRQYYTGVKRPAWQVSAGTAGVWTQVTVSFQEQDPFQVIIQGVIGYGRDGRIAIDNISFSWDCVREVDGSVRLVDGSRFDEGRVEIYHNHRWGTICNIGWTQTSADVVCAQLGYRTSVWTDSRYPAPESTPILLDDVTCDSRNKSKITECRTKPWGNWSPLCNHARDVSVRCLGQWHQCTSNQFVCDNAVCLPRSAQCDFTDDCGDRSDESDCGSYPGRCDFQNSLCNWVQPKNDTADWTRGFGGSEVGVPLVDHEGQTDGYFLYLTGAQETTANLQLPTYFIYSGANCSLLFHYQLNIGDASLSVLVAPSGTNARLEWQQNVSQGPNWLKQHVPISDGAPFQVSFHGTIGTPSEGSIAIDDVTLTPGCIIVDDGCNETSVTFRCNSGECISLDYVCDFQENCVDGSDELDCDKGPERCDFEEDLCSWSAGSGDIQFQRGRESTSTSGTGPPVDHTLQNPLGYYIFIDSSDSSEGQKARLISSVFSDDSQCQFRFFYHMQGRNIGSLHVLVRNVNNGSTEEVWRRQGQQGRGWLFGSVSIGTKTGDYQVILEAVVGNGDQGDIAMDDVSFATYCTLHRKGDHVGVSFTTVTIIAVSSASVVLLGISVAVFVIAKMYCRRQKIKKERYRTNSQKSIHQLGHLPARTEREDENSRTYEDLRRNSTNNYESFTAAGGRVEEWSLTQGNIKGQVEPDGAHAPSNDLFSVESSSQASLVNNTVAMATTWKPNVPCENENNYTMLVDERLRNFLEMNSFEYYIDILAENKFTYERLQSSKEADLINIGIPLAKSHAILSLFPGKGTSGNTRPNELIPSKYICPISNSVMKDPVRANDGYIYDRAAITAWFKRNNCTPNMEANRLELQPVDDLRKEINEFRKRRQERAYNRRPGYDVSPESVESDSSRCATPMTDVDC